jgi:hypothetical protein
MPLPSRRLIFNLTSITKLATLSVTSRHFTTMTDSSGQQTPISSGTDNKAQPKGNAKKEVKILMLHGQLPLRLIYGKCHQ